MPSRKKAIDRLVESLQERAKELDCLYRVEAILSNPDEEIGDVLSLVMREIPGGFQYPHLCQVSINLSGVLYNTPNFVKTPWQLSADIVVQGMVAGTLSVYYSEEAEAADKGPFLDEEEALLRTIATRLGHFIMYQKMRQVLGDFETPERPCEGDQRREWQFMLEMLKQTDRNLYLNISRKMLNHLCWSGVEEAERLLQAFGSGQDINGDDSPENWNRPHQRRALGLSIDFSSTAFRIAAENLSDEEILRFIQKWIQEDKLSFVVQVVNRNLSLSEVADAIRRYHYLAMDDPEVSSPNKRGIRVSLIRRFLSDQLGYINVAKHFIRVRDFYHLLEKVIFSAESHGKLGGKSAGLYLAAQILDKKGKESDLLSNVKVPKTWHITSDVLLHFMHYNNFDEVVEQKYKGIHQVRLEYPHILQTFKSARFPTDIVKGLSVALDDFGEHPLIVRSSSLLEDRVGAAFSGKYKSLFLANQGSKQNRLDALMDAIAEVYASTFGPDPIEYRTERGLIDFGEEMGIMIQEVVGTRVGKYFMPAFAGVAFSNNEFRWSPRINQKDGLVRIVPGLGTRAVDRLSNDYPVLVSPGQPGLRVNVTAEETIRYSPHEVDVIDLETNNFKTMPLGALLKEAGYEYPAAAQILSKVKDGQITKPLAMNIDFEHDDLIATFDGLINDTPFVKQMQAILQTLEETMGIPIDIEFASDGRDFYLLQCRAQSYAGMAKPAAIPQDVPSERIIFTADKYISNGRVPAITHLVYVDPKSYGEIAVPSTMVEVGRAVSKLNKLLPKRQFILMGPGRWGSRGDIKLGVNVTYSDINNTAALVEIARKKGNYVPDLSFGTHFFQDLVEADIRYLPLYPDDPGIVFNERFLLESRNMLEDILPEYAHLARTIRLIDIPASTGGLVLKVLMNADQDEAMGLLSERDVVEEESIPPSEQPTTMPLPGGRVDYWRWRLRMAERIAAEIEPKKYGVAGVYLIGSTKNASAGPTSDIDLIVHFRGSAAQRKELELWLDGWNKCLTEMNFMRTGIQQEGLLDVHFVTDRDIANKTSYAIKIGAPTDPARPLMMKGQQ